MSEQKDVQTQTYCHNCVFGIYDFGIQTGCKLNRLDKFDDKEFVDIDGLTAAKINRICMACRDEAWASKHEDPIQAVKDELQITFDFVLVANEDDGVGKLKTSLLYILNQTIKPYSVVVVIDSESQGKYLKEYLDTLNQFLTSANIKYQLVRCLEDDPVYERLWDLGAKKCKGVFHTVYNVGEIIPIDVVERVNSYYNDELKRFILIEPLHHYHMVMMTQFHNLVGGNDGGYIEDKVKFKAKEQENLALVHNWKDVCHV